MNSSDELRLQLVRASSARNQLMRIIGEVGSEIRKDRKKFLKEQGCDTLAEFLAQPDINLAESTFNTSIRLWNVFGSGGLNITEEQWVKIGPRKLTVILPYVEEQPELLDVAEHISTSDLIIEVKGQGGDKNEVKHGDSVPDVGFAVPRPPSLSPAKYRKLVKESPCCVCHKEASSDVQIQSHHFPQTRNRTDADWKVIPMCNLCHTEEQRSPLKFWNNYKANIMDFFYRMIVK